VGAASGFPEHRLAERPGQRRRRRQTRVKPRSRCHQFTYPRPMPQSGENNPQWYTSWHNEPVAEQDVALEAPSESHRAFATSPSSKKTMDCGRQRLN